jgi:hypothetical protein
MSHAGLNALKRSCFSMWIKCPLKKMLSFCPCSRALNRSGKGLKDSFPVTFHINSKLLCCWLDNFCLLRSYLFSCCCRFCPLLCLWPFYSVKTMEFFAVLKWIERFTPKFNNTHNFNMCFCCFAQSMLSYFQSTLLLNTQMYYYCRACNCDANWNIEQALCLEFGETLNDIW